MLPDTRYARLDDAYIAFQVVGSGPRDIVFMSAWFSHVDGRWEEPRFAAMLRRLSGMGRLILFDKRGSGASDPLPSDEPTWEQWSDDILAVMDAAQSDRAAVVGVGDSGPMAILFAAHHPERVSSLILANTGARLTRADDYPMGLTGAELDRFLDRAQRTWGTGGVTDVFSTSAADDDRYRQWWARYQRMGASPGRSIKMARLIFQMDARAVLPQIRVPTLILHRKDFRFFPIEQGRYLAEHIPGAKLVELEGNDGFLYLGDMNALVDEIEEFVTGVRRGQTDVDRALATVLITDMIGSTDMAAKIGDRRWREILDAHDEVVRQRLAAHRGRLHRATGDGILATFDGPGRAIRCAFEIRDMLRQTGVEIRTGIHTGEIEFRGNEIGGIAVHIAARLMSEAGPGEVIASETVKVLVTGSDVSFVDRGMKPLKGVPDQWRLYAVN